MNNFISTKINYFVEYHGKSEEDSDFGVLSKWFKEGKTIYDFRSIEDLVMFFEYKYHEDTTSNRTLCVFQMFEPKERVEMIHKVVIENSKTYLSFLSKEGGIHGRVISSMVPSDYAPLETKHRSEKEKRRTRKSLQMSEVTLRLSERAQNLI